MRPTALESAVQVGRAISTRAWRAAPPFSSSHPEQSQWERERRDQHGRASAFTVTKGSGNFLRERFHCAPPTCSSNDVLGCGQMGAHLQSLTATPGMNATSGVALGRYAGDGNDPRSRAHLDAAPGHGNRRPRRAAAARRKQEVLSTSTNSSSKSTLHVLSRHGTTREAADARHSGDCLAV